MKIIISIILSAVLLFAMSACESSSEEAVTQNQSKPETSSNTNNSSKSDESSTSKSDTSNTNINGSDTDDSSESSKESSSTNSNSSNEKSESEEEIFYGQWRIINVKAYGPAGTYSNDDVKKLIRKQLVFSKESATNFGDKIEDMDETVTDPVYKKTVIAKNDFPTNYRVTLEQLGIDGDSVTKVDASSTQGIGTVFFLTPDNNKLILFGGGTFFELEKLTPEEMNQNKAASLVEDYLSDKNELVQDENHFVQYEEMYNDYYIVRYSTLVSGHSSTNGRYAVDINTGEVIDISSTTDYSVLDE